jgi:hypothetical protein
MRDVLKSGFVTVEDVLGLQILPFHGHVHWLISAAVE